MPTTRAIKIIKKELHTSKNFLYSEKLRLAIEYYIAQLPADRQKSARQELPYLIQFGPILAKWGKLLPDVRLVNPGINYGGLTEYDKDAVYSLLPETYTLQQKNLNSNELPTYEFIRSTMSTIGFPCMLKANAGERGVGVFYIENELAAHTHFHKYTTGELDRVDSSIQAFAKYEQEYCLQFYQYHDQAGIHRIICGGLTWRNIPTVVGNGTDTVVKLINNTALAEHHKKNIIKNIHTTKPELLHTIPTNFQEIKIVYTASIDFGTIYKEILLDKEQKAKCEFLLKNILQHIPPETISVGRFDLKANSLEELLNGDIEIIELNAAGGIPTHVYSEELSVEKKYKELDKHFSIMMNIADARSSRYTAWLERLLARPEFLSISYRSLEKKGVSLFPGGEETELKILRKEIMRIIRISRWSRWKARIAYIANRMRDFGT